MEVQQGEWTICQAGQEAEVVAYHRHINLVLSWLEEAERRWYIASLSSAPGAVVLEPIRGLSDKTIDQGRQELEDGLKNTVEGRQRQSGGGRKIAKKRPGMSAQRIGSH